MHMLKAALKGVKMMLIIVVGFVLIGLFSAALGAGTGVLANWCFELNGNQTMGTSVLSGFVWCLILLGAIVGVMDEI